jgi:outer membrane protein OmpA-like peptidoglycan-associated protein
MYFMSDGHAGLGDSDLFMATRNGRTWSVPKNLGYPINTPGKEGALAIHPNREIAFFTSDRIRQQNDIWQFKLDSTLLPPPVSNLQGFVYDSKELGPVIADVIVFELADSTEVFRYATDAEGEFSTAITHDRPYGIHVSAKGYAFWSGQVSYPGSEPYGVKRIRVPLIPMGNEEVHVAGSAVVLRNIEFESGSAVLLTSSLHELRRLLALLKEYSDMHIQLRGHTDNVGTPADNLLLSEARAKSVYNWLAEQGVDAQRLSFKGFGESLPIAPNDTEAGRQENRRTEFIIR